MPKNIAYRTDEIARHYGSNRRRWMEFYPSERWVFERVVNIHGAIGRVLDVGCAAGGLGVALAERFPSLASYTGVEINQQATTAARAAAASIPVPADFVTADICDCPELAGRQYDLVTALSVVDWNVDAEGILAACWDHVEPGGHLVISLRLTPDAGISDVRRSFQYIWFNPLPIPPNAERAPYTVFNIGEALALLGRRSPIPAHILIYGYWGIPSQTARTPYERLVFAVAALRKPAASEPVNGPTVSAHLPDDVQPPVSTT